MPSLSGYPQKHPLFLSKMAKNGVFRSSEDSLTDKMYAANGERANFRHSACNAKIVSPNMNCLALPAHRRHLQVRHRRT